MIDPERLDQIARLTDDELDRQSEARSKGLDRHKKAAPKDRAVAHAAIDGLVVKAGASLDEKLNAFRRQCSRVGTEVNLGDVLGMADVYLVLDPAFRQRLHDKIDAPATRGEVNPYDGTEWEAKRAEMDADIDALGDECKRRQAKREQEAERLAALAER